MASPSNTTVESLGTQNVPTEELDSDSENDYILEEMDVYVQANLEDQLVKEALKTGVDLRHYSRSVENELLQVENASIQDYIRESRNIANLHKQIMSCDQILERMEEMLNGFQSDLNSISSEIQSLQRQSIDMNIRLKNRQAVRGELSQFVDEMAVPEMMINHIIDTQVTERTFLEQLHELNHKVNFVKEQSFKESRSCHDVREILDKLKIKSIEKIRKFLLGKIAQFRKPMTNYQVPQNALLKFRFFYEFLLSNDRQVAKEVYDDYIDSMSKICYSYFKGYISQLEKLEYQETADKDDLMGVEDTAKRGFFSTKPALKSKSTIFTLGNRGNILTTELEAPIIVPHTAQKAEQSYPFEALFRSLHFALLDNSCREYLFICDFFNITSGSAAAQELFGSIMGRTLNLCLKHVESYMSECYDSIAVFLCIHIIHRYRVVMHKRGVPAMDKYWDALLNCLHPRFEFILQLNIHSVRQCDPQKLGQIDVRPNYITRRYAEFSAAIVGLNESFPNERVNQLLSQLQNEVENFVLRMAAEFPQPRDQLVFLINNYDMILGVVMERTSGECKESDSFKDLLMARTQEYIEEALQPHFGGIMAFVKDCEAALDRSNIDSLQSQERKVAQLVRSFNNDWKKAIELLNHDIMRAFTNFKNGTQILQVTS